MPSARPTVPSRLASLLLGGVLGLGGPALADDETTPASAEDDAPQSAATDEVASEDGGDGAAGSAAATDDDDDGDDNEPEPLADAATADLEHLPSQGDSAAEGASGAEGRDGAEADDEGNIDLSVPAGDPPSEAPSSQPAEGLSDASEAPAAADGATTPAVSAADDVAKYGPPPKFWGFTLGLAAATRNLGVGFRLRYLKVFQSDFGTDYLLTSLVNGLSLDDLDAFRLTTAQTVGFKIRPWPFELDWRHSPRREGLIPEIILGGGGWAAAELDHALQYFRLKDAGYFGGASVGGFVSFAFADVSVTFLYRPLGVTGYWIDGAADYTPFSLGNPILDVNVTYTLPL